MRARDLTLDDVFEFDPTGGVERFAGERVLLLDAVALGLLRKNLIDSLGLSGARSLLARFGFSQGWRAAEALKESVRWDTEREWRTSGGRTHRLLGWVNFEPVPAADRRGPEPFAEGIWKDSFEAEQHLLHHGRAQECVCWTAAGFASGFLSHVNGETIYCIEQQCVARGDAVCRVIGHRRAEWPAEFKSQLAYYETECLSDAARKLQQVLKSVDRKHRQQQRNAPAEVDAGGMVVRSKAMRELVQQARRVAVVDSTVLLLGESGAGKERVARLIHESSLRQSGPFVALNCAAVPEALLESELFGHAKGAFTGAVTDRVGLFESAKGGTLLLDEVGELAPGMQAKLLRVLESKEIRRVGENRSRPIDVRVIAATHRSLEKDVEAGTFREDLYYRLKVIELRVPPLRERVEDIVPLARHALNLVCERTHLPARELSPTAAHKLTGYRWPGNVRELMNTMERAALLSRHRRIEVEDLPDDVKKPQVKVAPVQGQTLADAEREFILATLTAENGNRTRAAQRLDIGAATLFRKLKQYQKAGQFTK